MRLQKLPDGYHIGNFFILIEFRCCIRGRIKLDSELNFQLTFAHSPAGYHSVDRVGPTKHESIACAWKGLFGSENPELSSSYL